MSSSNSDDILWKSARTSSHVGTLEQSLAYLSGFDNTFESEAIPNMLPLHRNNPKNCPGNLYAEQLSGTAFTAPRCTNRRTWTYRTLPSAAGTSSQYVDTGIQFGHCEWGTDLRLNPNPMRWFPRVDEESKESVNFIDGTRTMAGSGSPIQKEGLAIHTYIFNSNMTHLAGVDRQSSAIQNSDGDFLIVPQRGSLIIRTELGLMTVSPSEVCMIPRGLVFSVDLYLAEDDFVAKNGNENAARGYILEVFNGHFSLPERGPIGSNGLANERDFLVPTAHLDIAGKNDSHLIMNKFGNSLFSRVSKHSPYNVVAFHGNYVPFKYNLKHFCAMNSVTYDHPDPSIYTVLTVPSEEKGTALADFVIFPPRIMSTDENTLRPPWYHKNCMSEYMGLILGEYDAKEGDGFVPGGSSLHNCMTPHGPDTVSYQKAIEMDCSSPQKFNKGLAFMFETKCILKVSEYALQCEERDTQYPKCWDGLTDNFQVRR